MFWHEHRVAQRTNIVTLYRQGKEMTPKGKTQVSARELDERARLIEIKKLIEYIEGGLENVAAHKDKLKRLLNEQGKKKDEEK